jgi:hypothetical protein
MLGVHAATAAGVLVAVSAVNGVKVGEASPLANSVGALLGRLQAVSTTQITSNKGTILSLVMGFSSNK